MTEYTNTEGGNDYLRPPYLSDDALALLFAEEHADNLRYVAFSSRWLRWNGIRWEPDRTLSAFDSARLICRVAAAECNDQKVAASLASAKTVAAVERLAKTDRRIAATLEQFDASPDIFSGGGITIDLRIKREYKARQDDFVSKVGAVAPAPEGTPCPIWEAFLFRVTGGDTELIGFLKRYCGYCLTGHTSEHVFAFLHGSGSNGKSTFIRTVAAILGDYAAVVPMELLMASDADRHPTELAKLHGVRLAIANETERNRRWDEAKVKQLTGGDKLTGRYMRQDFFDFEPSHKFLIAGNHKPSLTGIDEANRRRLLLIPFAIQIPAAERDPELPEKLKSEYPAILRWMIEGHAEWRRSGLMVPAIVRDASDAYFTEQDTLGHWLEECCTVATATSFARTRDLFASWRTWNEERNLRPGSEKIFSETMADRGFAKDKDSRTRQAVFRGLSLVTRQDETDWSNI